jgi:hypothetical protein
VIPVAASAPSTANASRLGKGTLIGVSTPIELMAAPPPPPPPPPAPEVKRNVPKGTMMGVALPGIAPTNDKPKPAPVVARKAPAFVPPPPPPAAPPPGMTTLAIEPESLPSKKGSRAPAVILIVLAVLGIAGVIAWVSLRGHPPPSVRAEVRGDAAALQLYLRCEKCADGTAIDLGEGRSASFLNSEVSFPLAAGEIKAGTNTFKGTVTQKGEKPHPLSLDVPIPYLVTPSLSPLAKGEPAIEVVFEVSKDVKSISVDGENVEIEGGTATARVVVPVGGDDAKTFDRTVKYEVTQAKGDPTKGSLKLSVPYAPLRVGLPGRRPLVEGDGLDVSGHTQAGATVRLGAAPDAPTVVSDKDGLFKGRAKIASDAKTLEVRAFGPKLAPRAITMTLSRDAKALRAEAVTPFDKIAEAPDANAGKIVVLKMTAEQSGEDEGRALAVGEAKCGATEPGKCPVVRILLPSGAAPAKGALIEVVGVVVRGVPILKGKATAIEIDASIVTAEK